MSVVSKSSFPTIPDYVAANRCSIRSSIDGVKISDIRAIDWFCEPPEEGLMCEILWSGPQPNPVRGPSKRGVGLPFGGDVTKRLLKDNNLGNEMLRAPESDSKSSNEPVQEKKIILKSICSPIRPEDSLDSVNSEVNSVSNRDKNNVTRSKSTPRSRYKGKSIRTSPRGVKTVIRTKTVVKKKSKLELTFAASLLPLQTHPFQ
ncbi:putative protein-serine/threonine phosphatase [Helianthus anomalus]